MLKTIQRITQIPELTIPKSVHHRSRVVSAFWAIAGEIEQSWLVPCLHFLAPPASSNEINSAEQELGYPIPNQYRQFLEVTNGAQLFVVPRNRPEGGEPHVRFRLFSCDELVRCNQFLCQTFVDAYSTDPEYRSVRCLNYMAFCDAADDNYQAVLLDGPHAGRVFFLFYEFQARPYDELDSAFYYTISESLKSWLNLILDSGGWEGRGEQVSGI